MPFPATTALLRPAAFYLGTTRLRGQPDDRLQLPPANARRPHLPGDGTLTPPGGYRIEADRAEDVIAVLMALK